MKKSPSRFAAFAAVAALLAGLGTLHAVFGGMAGGHLAQSDCASCHVAGANVNAGNAGMLTANQEVLCARCHEKAIRVSHPSGMTPKGRIPPDYPLDWKGDVTCSTCHLIHGDKPHLIRGARAGKALCLACHTQQFFEGMRDSGLSTVSAHIGASRGFDPALLDPYSAKCLGCHERNVDSRISTRIDSKGVVRHGGQAGNHPIAVDYASVAARSKRYHPVGALSKKILLPDGKVSCVSCHMGYSKEHGKLVMSNAGSALCFQCHDI